ncbi:MAG: hypothetical protein RSB55_03085 [Oscillospiraceae bacterium]
MASGVEELLDMLYDMVEEAKGFPLSGDKCMVERDKALDILDDVRGQFPVEFAEARKLLATRNDYLASAKREAELIRKQAESEARQMVGENELMSQAKQRSMDIVHQAEQQARDLRRAANEYCDDALRRTEEAVSEAHEEITRSRAKFRTAAGGTAVTAQSGKSMYDVEAEG